MTLQRSVVVSGLVWPVAGVALPAGFRIEVVAEGLTFLPLALPGERTTHP